MNTDMNTEKFNYYDSTIRQALGSRLTSTSYQFGKLYRGKVRDTYDLGDKLLLITTDRQSAFDKVIATVPFKGQVLNLTSAWWFEETESIVPNHLLQIPDPNAMIAKKCQVFPIEFVVRGYITGSTSTSLWTQYNKGVRNYCGLDFPEGLVKNQRLDQPVLTPTTKETHQDRPISPKEIIAEGWMQEQDFAEASAAALKLFEFGSKVAERHGLILVDTKYEFGRDADGRIVVVDEIHTPDSSRYWLKDSYQSRLAEGKEPENIDKEFLRLWFTEHCDPYQDHPLPEAPEDLIVTLSSRYIQLYEMITGKKFNFPQSTADLSVSDRIMRNVAGFLG